MTEETNTDLLIIKPEVGRVVLYRPTYAGDLVSLDRDKRPDLRQPMSAQVAYVHQDRMVNLSVADHEGRQFPVTNVRLVQPGDEAPPHDHAHYSAFQIEQARREQQRARDQAELDALLARTKPEAPAAPAGAPTPGTDLTGVPGAEPDQSA